MVSRKQTRLAEIRLYAQQRGLSEIDAAHFHELCGLLAPLSEAALQRLLRISDIPLSPMVEGVRQDSFEELERTLIRLAGEYTACTGDDASSRRLRRMVIKSKEHARFAARSASDEGRRRMKKEMLEWLLIWLENPPIFPQWVKLRRGSTTSSVRSTPP